ncbi:hypothetical protein Poli38472_008709 [Pythium oligandrum]|uniref:Uncharacterized protein n=1 Tax=Pythium oligandrum TaxID=41045 RepID=A0A8K1C3X7_PYTOL|nr:hypothetical protein Poli38472_008709 [Pythium oligandrum]|eukprot:TMW56061.1 hypothetical protein Poli38472_008709 [Pythium oligandrum]
MTGYTRASEGLVGTEHKPLLAMPRGGRSFGEEESGRPAAVHPVPAKYIIENYKTSSTRKVAATYGTMTLSPIKNKHSRKDVVCIDIDLECSQVSNQSETESDSDGSCEHPASAPSSASGLQSILRIRTGEFSERTLEKKQSSVGFAIDIVDSDTEDEDSDEHIIRPVKETKRRRRSCTSRCTPRRLTIEEKAALYQIRPDLELVPTQLLIRDLEEKRRRQQRRLVFSVLAATILLFMMIVAYYIFTQVGQAV